MASTVDKTTRSFRRHVFGYLEIVTLSTVMIIVAASLSTEIRMRKIGGICQSSASVMTKKKMRK